MNPAERKADRLLKIEALLLAHPEGLTQSEIARRLGVNRSTINRYLPDLPRHFFIEDDGRWKVDRAAYLVNVRFNLHEALAVHLAARLLATRMERQNPHAAAALRKLGIALDPLSPRISAHMQQSADVMDDAAQRSDPGYLAALECLTLAWAEGHKVKVWHRHTSGRIDTYIFAPYFIEPYAVGQSTHVIGWREPPGALRTFKIERIERAETLREPYQIPADFDLRQLLENAWGIWYTDESPVEVTLRFHARVAGRVHETRWHRSEVVVEQPDGSLLWKASIAEPQEMLPWIRGWGADVEVLKPESLRNSLTTETIQLSQLYLGEEQPSKMKNQFIAHLRKNDKVPQSLWNHLSEASVLAGQFTMKVGLKETGEILGILHDLGKASKEFQAYILSATGIKNPDADDYVDAAAKKGKVDHSSAGAQIIYRNLIQSGSEGLYTAQILSLCIASHHSGLIDSLTPDGQNNFIRRIDKPEEYTHADEALSNLNENEKRVIDDLLSNKLLTSQLILKLKSIKENNDSQETFSFKCGLLIRFLFSCLIDADRLSTADFEIPNNTRVRNYGQYDPWETLIQRLDKKIEGFENKENKNVVDEIRSQVSHDCLAFSSKPQGLFQLTVPTGGGKTLASLRFALNHALQHKMDRIFYIIPYTSIIDQNADEVRKILEDQDDKGHYLDRVILEHHSNLTPEEESRRHNLLAENWDAPIVFTTQVQFLETLFSSGTRSARRMHQLANSVIIFDEVQTIPIRCVHMFNLALRFLVHDCRSSVVLCTATQPLLDKIVPIQRSLTIHPEQRMISNEKELFEKLKRVEVFDRRKTGGWADGEVADLVEQELREKGSVLIIVNTKSSARSIYQEISEKKIAEVYHLSTNMCPAHRLSVLNIVKEKLERKEPVVCVSTQLIEAGVDIDFGSVIRYLAGLDSIVQAAGRCNRNGYQKVGNVWIVNPREERIQNLKDIRIGIENAERVLDEYKDAPERFTNDRLGPIALMEYYKYYFYQRKDEMKYNLNKDSLVGREDDLFNLLSKNSIAVDAYQRVTKTNPAIPFKQSFQTAAKAFYAIDTPTQGVVVPYGKEGERIVCDLCSAFDIEKQYKLLKKAQRYSVNLFPYEFKQMADLKAIQEVQKDSGIYYLDNQYYSDQFGWSDETVNDMETLIC